MTRFFGRRVEFLFTIFFNFAHIKETYHKFFMEQKYLYINSRDEFHRVDISKIVYFEADANCTHFVLSNKLKGTIGINLAQTQRLLSERLKEDAAIFARIGKRFIVNLDYVCRIEILKQRLLLSDGEHFAYSLPVSKDALRKLREMYVEQANHHKE